MAVVGSTPVAPRLRSVPADGTVGVGVSPARRLTEVRCGFRRADNDHGHATPGQPRQAPRRHPARRARRISATKCVERVLEEGNVHVGAKGVLVIAAEIGTPDQDSAGRLRAARRRTAGVFPA